MTLLLVLNHNIEYNRYETFNSLIRTRNIFGNKQAPSRDIAQGFGVLEHLRFICAGGSFTFDGKERYVFMFVTTADCGF